MRDPYDPDELPGEMRHISDAERFAFYLEGSFDGMRNCRCTLIPVVDYDALPVPLPELPGHNYVRKSDLKRMEESFWRI